MRNKAGFSTRSSLVLAIAVALLFVLPIDQAAAQAFNTEIAEFVANELGKKSHEDGVLIAYVVTTEMEDRPVSPIRVWRVRNGNLMDENAEALEKALSRNREDWPPHTFIFAFELLNPMLKDQNRKHKPRERMTVEIRQFYDMGMLATSRGGKAFTWEIERRSGQWLITEHSPHMYGD